MPEVQATTTAKFFGGTPTAISTNPPVPVIAELTLATSVNGDGSPQNAVKNFGGGPVGLDNIAAAIGESTDTIEDVIEPYLIQQGYLQRTPRGRMATHSIWQHFGLAPPRAGGADLFGQ